MDENGARIESESIVAQVSAVTGALSSIRFKTQTSTTIVENERLTIRPSASHQTKTPSQIRDVEVTVDQALDFYTRIRTVGQVGIGKYSLTIERTYEFTNGPHVYEQLSISAPEPIWVDEIAWSFQSTSGAWAGATTEDLFVHEPTAPLGGLNRTLPGCVAQASPFTGAKEQIRRIIIDKSSWDGACIGVLRKGWVLLANTVFAAHSLSEALEQKPKPRFSFYQITDLEPASFTTSADHFQAVKTISLS